MNTEQKLADIHMLVMYIKEHISTEPASQENAHLDEIGKTTLEIAEMLQSVKANTGTKADTLFHAYKDTVDAAASKILEKLQNIKTTVDTNTGKTNELYAKVEEIYIDYTGILEKSTKTLELQRENYANEIRTLISEVESLSKMTKALKEKTMSEQEVKDLVSGLEHQLSEIIKNDTSLNETYEQNADRLESMVNDIQKSYQSLNETLVSVDGSFKTAVSRLDVLLMQMNLLTKEGGN